MRVLWDINTKEIKLLMKVLYKSIENSETPNKDEITIYNKLKNLLETNN